MEKSKGWSLFELLISLVILTILAMMCLPLGFSIQQKNQLQIIENEISTAIRYARQMAIINGTSLALTTLSKSGNWAEGMILFVDNKKHQYNTHNQPLHQWQWKHSGIYVSWQGFQSNAYLIFSSELSHAATNGAFCIKDNHGDSIKLVINRFGQITRRSILPA